ncbi:MAG: hypothetical protein AAF228_11100 [Pseudomonadota bacterium]
MEDKNMRYCLLLSILFMLCACTGDGSAPPPHAMYRGDFNPQNIACVENTIRKISEKWDFRVIEKDRQVMKRVNEGTSAFYILAIKKDGDLSDINSWIMSIGSFINGSRINFTIGNYKELSVMKKDKLAQEVVGQLSAKCNTQLIRYTEPYGQKPQK